MQIGCAGVKCTSRLTFYPTQNSIANARPKVKTNNISFILKFILKFPLSIFKAA